MAKRKKTMEVTNQKENEVSTEALLEAGENEKAPDSTEVLPEVGESEKAPDGTEVLPEAGESGEVPEETENLVKEEIKEDIPIFYVMLKVQELAVRATPEFKADNSNVVDMLKNSGKPIGISVKKGGYGKMVNSDGWIQLEHTVRFNG